MRIRILGTIAAAGLVFAACGGSDTGGLQGEVADMLLESAGDEGFDEACMREGLDSAALATGDFPTEVFECIDLDG